MSKRSQAGDDDATDSFDAPVNKVDIVHVLQALSYSVYLVPGVKTWLVRNRNGTDQL